MGRDREKFRFMLCKIGSVFCACLPSWGRERATLGFAENCYLIIMGQIMVRR